MRLRTPLSKSYSIYSQCKSLLADPQVTGQTYLAAALKGLDAVYTKVSSVACESVIVCARAEVQQHQALQAALALCRCPQIFHSEEEARSWGAKIDHGIFSFSKAMKTDALLIRARAAEWTDDLRSMYVHAAAALAEKPDHASARYWLVRTKLHLPSGDPAAGVTLNVLPDIPEWKRLVLQIRLYQEPTFTHAAALLPALEEAQRTLDAVEKKLTVNLLKHALTVGPTSTSGEIAECARLCKSVEQIVGRQPWLQVNIAIQELRGERKYDTALQRLEAADVLKEPRAALLARVARILAGAPKPSSNGEEQDGLTIIEAAMQQILHSVSTKQPEDALVLGQRLERARQDPICAEFPALATVADSLRFVAGVLFGAPTTQSTVTHAGSMADAPPWVAWLHLRAILIQAASALSAPLLAPLPVSDLAAAWQVENWWTLYGPPGGEIPRAVKQSKDHLTTSITALPEAVQSFLGGVRRSRAEGYRGAVISQPAQFNAGFWGLGDWCNAVCQEELGFEAEYIKARKQVGVPDFLNGHNRLSDSVESGSTELLSLLSPISRAWWEPAVTYWVSVARLDSDPQDACAALQSLTAGPKSSEAKAQLALLAIKERDLDAADHWVAAEPPHFPGVLYAQALLQVRRGDAQQATRLLEVVEANFGQSGSPYVLASRRLPAALAERSGDTKEAERIHRATLSAYPADPVTSARLGRLLLQQTYQQVAGGLPPDSDGLIELLRDATQPPSAAVDWSRDYCLLHRLLTAPEPELDEPAEEIRTRRAPPKIRAWHQVLIHRLLQARRARDAWELIEKESTPTSPHWQSRTQLIFRAWRLLTSLWLPYRAPDAQMIEAEALRLKSEGGAQDETVWQTAEARARAQAVAASISPDVLRNLANCAQEMDQWSPAQSDDLVRRWRFLIACALEYGQDSNPALNPASWRQIEPWALADVPALCSEDTSERARAAEILVSAISSNEICWDEEQRWLLKAVAAHATGKEDAFLDGFVELEPALNRLPVEVVGLWLAAASIWFRKKNWKKLLEGDLPDAVADLTDPRARLIIGLAYAHSAADESLNGDVRRAQQRVRQAHATLEPLVAQGGK